MQNLAIDIAELKKNLGEKYSALAIDNPKDPVEHYVNRKLQAVTKLLAVDSGVKRVTEHKLDGFLAMRIPAEYEALIFGRAKVNFHRDIITSPKAIVRLLLIYGIPYTLLVLDAGTLIGRWLF